jgi:carbonic anhydrase
MNYDRRAFLLQASAGLALSAMTPEIAVAAGDPAPTDATSALAALKAGNERFVADKATCPPLTARRLEIAEQQHPFATILSCSDSRVPVESVFDQPSGSIFGIRLAGNFIERAGTGSIEYSFAELNVPLLLVLGHSDCGAVKAALAYNTSGTKFPGLVQFVVENIAPGIKGANNMHDAVIANVKYTMADIRKRSTIVDAAVAAGKAKMVGGVYDLNSGKVTLVA